MNTIGERLREERERLALSQTVFAEVGGVQKRAQINYEQGERFPGADYLAAVGKLGVDVQYIVTGEHCPGSLTADEDELLSHFRAAPLAVKAAMMAAGKAGSAPASTMVKVKKGVGQQQFNGPVGNVTSGDVVNQRKPKE